MSTPGRSLCSRRCFQRALWFTYHATERETRVEAERKRTQMTAPNFSRHFHQVRDGLAFAELWSVIALSGCGYGGALLNLPARAYPGGEVPSHPVELGPTDLIVLVTRPPLDDEPHGDKPVQRSGTDLEGRVLGALRTWFLECCSRVEVRLHPRLRERLKSERPDLAQRGCVEYSQKMGTYTSTWTTRFLESSSAGQKGRRLRTGGYLIFTPEGWPGGPGIVTAFGMGGIETMTWARALRVRYPELVRATIASDQLSVCFAEWTPPLRTPMRPESLGFLDDCTPEILFRATSPRMGLPRWEIL